MIWHLDLIMAKLSISHILIAQHIHIFIIHLILNLPLSPAGCINYEYDHFKIAPVN